jgi:hypothetical protein
METNSLLKYFVSMLFIESIIRSNLTELVTSFKKIGSNPLLEHLKEGCLYFLLRLEHVKPDHLLSLSKDMVSLAEERCLLIQETLQSSESMPCVPRSSHKTEFASSNDI